MNHDAVDSDRFGGWRTLNVEDLRAITELLGEHFLRAIRARPFKHPVQDRLEGLRPTGNAPRHAPFRGALGDGGWRHGVAEPQDSPDAHVARPSKRRAIAQLVGYSRSGPDEKAASSRHTAANRPRSYCGPEST